MRIFLTLAALLFPAAGVASEPALAPASPWNVRYEQNVCELRRTFGSGDSETLFLLSAGSNLGTGKIVLVTKGKTGNSRKRIAMELGTATYPEKLRGQIFYNRKTVESVWQVFGIDTNWFENSVKDDILIISSGKSRRLALAVGKLSEPMAALATCQRDLLAQMGFDHTRIANLKSLPKPANYPGYWLLASDYPSHSLRLGHQGATTFQIEVLADGKIGDCSILKSSGHKELDQASCRAMTANAKFHPAVDKDGNPVAAPYVSTTTWSIPD
ncbi:MAG: energy transducer TonB [Pseudomonadota bacterium]